MATKQQIKTKKKTNNIRDFMDFDSVATMETWQTRQNKTLTLVPPWLLTKMNETLGRYSKMKISKFCGIRHVPAEDKSEALFNQIHYYVFRKPNIFYPEIKAKVHHMIIYMICYLSSIFWLSVHCSGCQLFLFSCQNMLHFAGKLSMSEIYISDLWIEMSNMVSCFRSRDGTSS